MKKSRLVDCNTNRGAISTENALVATDPMSRLEMGASLEDADPGPVAPGEPLCQT